MVDFWGASNLCVEGDIAVGEFAAYYVGVLGEGCVG